MSVGIEDVDDLWADLDANLVHRSVSGDHVRATNTRMGRKHSNELAP
jgi:hypothetical protein